MDHSLVDPASESRLRTDTAIPFKGAEYVITFAYSKKTCQALTDLQRQNPYKTNASGVRNLDPVIELETRYRDNIQLSSNQPSILLQSPLEPGIDIEHGGQEELLGELLRKMPISPVANRDQSYECLVGVSTQIERQQRQYAKCMEHPFVQERLSKNKQKTQFLSTREEEAAYAIFVSNVDANITKLAQGVKSSLTFVDLRYLQEYFRRKNIEKKEIEDRGEDLPKELIYDYDKLLKNIADFIEQRTLESVFSADNMEIVNTYPELRSAVLEYYDAATYVEKARQFYIDFRRIYGFLFIDNTELVTAEPASKAAYSAQSKENAQISLAERACRLVHPDMPAKDRAGAYLDPKVIQKGIELWAPALLESYLLADSQYPHIEQAMQHELLQYSQAAAGSAARCFTTALFENQRNKIDRGIEDEKLHVLESSKESFDFIEKSVMRPRMSPTGNGVTGYDCVFDTRTQYSLSENGQPVAAVVDARITFRSAKEMRVYFQENQVPYDYRNDPNPLQALTSIDAVMELPALKENTDGKELSYQEKIDALYGLSGVDREQQKAKIDSEKEMLLEMDLSYDSRCQDEVLSPAESVNAAKEFFERYQLTKEALARAEDEATYNKGWELFYALEDLRALLVNSTTSLSSTVQETIRNEVDRAQEALRDPVTSAKLDEVTTAFVLTLAATNARDIDPNSLPSARFSPLRSLPITSVHGYNQSRPAEPKSLPDPASSIEIAQYGEALQNWREKYEEWHNACRRVCQSSVGQLVRQGALLQQPGASKSAEEYGAPYSIQIFMANIYALYESSPLGEEAVKSNDFIKEMITFFKSDSLSAECTAWLKSYAFAHVNLQEVPAFPEGIPLYVQKFFLILASPPYSRQKNDIENIWALGHAVMKRSETQDLVDAVRPMFKGNPPKKSDIQAFDESVQYFNIQAQRLSYQLAYRENIQDIDAELRKKYHQYCAERATLFPDAPPANYYALNLSTCRMSRSPDSSWDRFLDRIHALLNRRYNRQKIAIQQKKSLTGGALLRLVDNAYKPISESIARELKAEVEKRQAEMQDAELLGAPSTPSKTSSWIEVWFGEGQAAESAKTAVEGIRSSIAGLGFIVDRRLDLPSQEDYEHSLDAWHEPAFSKSDDTISIPGVQVIAQRKKKTVLLKINTEVSLRENIALSSGKAGSSTKRSLLQPEAMVVSKFSKDKKERAAQQNAAQRQFVQHAVRTMTSPVVTMKAECFSEEKLIRIVESIQLLRSAKNPAPRFDLTQVVIKGLESVAVADLSKAFTAYRNIAKGGKSMSADEPRLYGALIGEYRQYLADRLTLSTEEGRRINRGFSGSV